MKNKQSTSYTTHLGSAEELGASPWSLQMRCKLLAWECCWFFCCKWTPKPANKWRLCILRLFGATIQGRPFVHQRARIQIPWNIELQDRSCIGDRTHLYSLDRIVVGERSIIAQEAYLCTGTHSLSHPNKPLKTAPIHIGSDVFIGARAFIFPGVRLIDSTVIGACEVIRDAPIDQV
jgi:putative colanic acid biosynthesis acetyltransferase WcaF